MAKDNLQQQIDEAINEKLRQEEEWEEQYGHLFREKKPDKLKPTGGTLAGQAERMKANKGYARGKGQPKIIVKIKKKVMSDKLLVILGPTASGKTALAVKLARQFNGEIISADSRQVYRGLDVGTGKDLKEYKKIPYHLIDIISPKKQLTLADWQELALQRIKEIQQRGKLPILCGGTGLYISSIVDGYQLPKIKNSSVGRRTKLNKLTLKQLLARLKQVDFETYKIIDKKNRRRVQRSLEIYYQTGLPKSAQLKKQKADFDILQIGIKLPKEKLYQKIDKRLKNWLEKEGLIEEVKKLRKQGISWQRLEYFGLEYKWVAQYLQKKIDYQTMVEQSKKDLRHYAKRQMTWFKRDERIKWVEDYNQAEKFLSQFLLQ